MSLKNIHLKQLDEECEKALLRGIENVMMSRKVVEEMNICEYMGATREQITAILNKYSN